MKYPNREAVLKMLDEAEANGETVFFLRSRDRAAVAALVKYRDECDSMDTKGCRLTSHAHVGGIQDVIERFVQFRRENPEKMKWAD